MAYQFVEKKKHPQEQMAFIVYMILSSYFHKAVCRDAVMAERLYLYYKDLSEKSQWYKEEKVIKAAQKVLGSYEKLFAQMNCEVRIRKRKECYRIDLITGFEQVRAEIDEEGGFEIECREMS